MAYKEDIRVFYDLKYEPRELQIDALSFTKNQIRHGKKYIMLNMPTGTGKSYFAVMFANWYKNYINEEAHFDILTNTKILQAQYTQEFPFISNVSGRNSYQCHSYHGMTCQDGKEMNEALKRHCSACPYETDLQGWKHSDLSLTNFHLFDAISLFLPHIMEEKKQNVLIIDEAHDFESVLCDFISMRITKRSLSRVGFSDRKIASLYKIISKDVNSVLDFYVFVRDVYIVELEKQLKKLTKMITKDGVADKEKIKYSRQASNIRSAAYNYGSFLEHFSKQKDNWVLEKEDNRKETSFPVSYIVQPVWSFDYLNDVVWSKYDHVLFMSGTILDRKIFSYINGIDARLSAYYEVDTPFHVKTRPIYYIRVGKMTYDRKEETFQMQLEYIDKILKRNSDKKGIIHTGNYEIARWLEDKYGNNGRLIFHTTETRTEALNEHLISDKPTVLVSPSMMNGIDLKDDLSRFQIILKIPYPNIKSRKIKQRQKDNKEWYKWKTVVDLVQSYGRSVRSTEDWAETYILDESFSNIMRYNFKYLPHYFTDAVKTLRRK